MNLEDLQARVSAAFADREKLKEPFYTMAVKETVALLDRGVIRVAQKAATGWEVNAWVKEAILCFFAASEMKVSETPPFEFHDKIPLKKGLADAGVRVVPPGTVRYGAFCERGVVVMPGYVNIGAWVGAGTMVDTWATVGSCAQIGRNVHLRAASASAACSSHPLLHPSSSKTAPSSAAGPSSSRACRWAKKPSSARTSS
jgi:2,3,4,5-tetrahydropyridine-2,6-dicarboxylate N-succinyltransferase